MNAFSDMQRLKLISHVPSFLSEILLANDHYQNKEVNIKKEKHME